jgi:hypothetical protein
MHPLAPGSAEQRPHLATGVQQKRQGLAAAAAGRKVLRHGAAIMLLPSRHVDARPGRQQAPDQRRVAGRRREVDGRGAARVHRVDRRAGGEQHRRRGVALLH